MAITTRLAPLYGGQKIFATLLCAVFGIWGIYDYAVKIPRQEAVYAEFETLAARLKVLKESYEKQKESGGTLSEAEQAELTTVTDRLMQLAPSGAAPVKPSKFNRATQWFYMACLPFAPWFFWMFLKAKRQTYTLDDEGNLHFTGDKELHDGQWSRDEITDIDMDRWMAKSIAYAVHADGRRLKLDAYLHKDLHLIIGAIASRFHPDQWDSEGKTIKHNEEPSPDDLADSDDAPADDDAVSQNAAS